MDVFTLDIDTQKFRLTNAAWNELTLNSPWSVGYVTNLIEQQQFENKESWELFYYNSGVQRLNKMLQQNEATQQLLKNINYTQDKKALYALPANIKEINFNYGRSADCLEQKATDLFLYLNQQGVINLTLAECVSAVRFRVICETWNGVVIRERKAITVLQKEFVDLVFQKTSGQDDFQYAVDYLAFSGNKMIAGIQIKPKSFLGTTTYIEKARAANKEKNKKFTEKYGVPVFNVYAETNGDIVNKEATQLIRQIL